MINLYDKKTGDSFGTITPEQLQFLIDQLEEESSEDQDYAVTPMLLDYFATRGADPDLLALLREALGDREEVVIEWSRG